MTDTLKPCPFCGTHETSEGDCVGVNNLNDLTFWVSCSKCGADGPREETEAEAIAAWNRRAVPEITTSMVERAAEMIAGEDWRTPTGERP